MALNRNIKYKSKWLLAYFSKKRKLWRDFYPSEKKVFKKIFAQTRSLGDVLDVGCACGGLGRALSSTFKLDSYTGVDINSELIRFARKDIKSGIKCDFFCGDILDLKFTKDFDTVVSLSCADWNIEVEKMVRACWRRVKLGGYFVISLRLTGGRGVNDIRRSFQYIGQDDPGAKPEIANYVVFNLREALALMKGLSPKPGLIGAYGYWGKPSPTAVTAFKKLVFAVFYLKKGAARQGRLELDLPKDFIRSAAGKLNEKEVLKR